MKEIKYTILRFVNFCDSILLRFRNRTGTYVIPEPFAIPFYGFGTVINYGSGYAKPVIKLWFQFRYGKKLQFLQFRFRSATLASGPSVRQLNS